MNLRDIGWKNTFAQGKRSECMKKFLEKWL